MPARRVDPGPSVNRTLGPWRSPGPQRKNALGVSPNWRLNIVANAPGLS
jgi:hypothetical protein